MKIYLVGGAVRDALLGLPVKDRDWVVVGATPQQLLDAGYQQVGRDFPVFLHPQSREEYALARTERKSAPAIPVSPVMPPLTSPLSKIYCAAISPLTRWLRTLTVRFTIPMAARPIYASACCATSPRPLAKIRYAYCASRVLPHVMPISVFALPMKPWR